MLAYSRLKMGSDSVAYLLRSTEGVIVERTFLTRWLEVGDDAAQCKGGGEVR
jgi:hypothetical protein